MDHLKAEEMLSALGTVMEEQKMAPVDIVVCGAMVLLMQGALSRPTRDIDGLGLVEEEDGVRVLKKPLLSREFSSAVERVGALYGEGKRWFSTAAITLHEDTDLPPDIIDMAQARSYGGRLTVRLCCRRHMVCLKMWAAVHRGGAGHRGSDRDAGHRGRGGGGCRMVPAAGPRGFARAPGRT